MSQAGESQDGARKGRSVRASSESPSSSAMYINNAGIGGSMTHTVDYSEEMDRFAAGPAHSPR